MKNKIFGLIWLMFSGLFFSCSLYSKDYVPYVVSGEMTIEESPEYKVAGLNLSFLNKEEKNVSKFIVVFFLFDEDGNSPLIGRNSIVLQISSLVGSQDVFEQCISLDRFIGEIPEEPYSVDYLYVSEIVYEDGSVWKDPFGVYVF